MLSLRTFFVLLLAAVAGLFPGAASSAGEATPPNIVLIYADDLGWRDTGHGGSDYYETPHLDRLASEGMVFTDGYAPAALCAPSRAAWLAGQTPARTGFYGHAGSILSPSRMRVLPEIGRFGYPAGEPTVAGVLRDAGYVTGVIGKWQLPAIPGTSPSDLGFSFVHRIEPKKGAKPDEAAGPKHIDEIAREAVRFLEENRDRPFFLYVSHLAVHTPREARPEMFEKYAAKERGRLHRDARYAAMVAHLDDSVGVVLAAIDRLGLADRTLVVFTSDNGASLLSSQAPLSGAKGSYLEGGIRVPMVARLPGTIPAGAKTGVPASQIDLFPTFLDLAGVPTPSGKTLDGETLAPLLRDGTPPSRQALYWHAPGYAGRGGRRSDALPFASRPVSAVRKGDWKLLLHHDRWSLDGGREKIRQNRAVELFDLSTDIGERRDLAGANPEKRDELLADLLAWLESNDARIAGQANPRFEDGVPVPHDRR